MSSSDINVNIYSSDNKRIIYPSKKSLILKSKNIDDKDISSCDELKTKNSIRNIADKSFLHSTRQIEEECSLKNDMNTLIDKLQIPMTIVDHYPTSNINLVKPINVNIDNIGLQNEPWLSLKENDDLIKNILERFREYYLLLKEKSNSHLIYIFNEIYYELIDELLDVYSTELNELNYDNFEMELFNIVKQCFYCMIYNNFIFVDSNTSFSHDKNVLFNIKNHNYNISSHTWYNNNSETIPQSDDFNTITKKIDYLSNIPQPKQRTKEWYLFRYNLITASNAYKVLGSEAQRNSLIYEKCCPLVIDEPSCDNDKPIKYTNTSTTLHWGQKYEPLSVQIYQIVYNTKISEFGCIQHSSYPFIGASPDGINIDKDNSLYGRMLEVKNIVNRPITGIPKKEYMIQMQMQMETCDLNECDFLETKFIEYVSNDVFYNNLHKSIESGYKKQTVQNNCIDDFYGVIIEFQDINSSAPIYKYYIYDNNTIHCEKCNTIDCVCTIKEKITQWINDTICNTTNIQIEWMNTFYWHLDIFSCVLIKRDKKWFNDNIEKFKNIWDIILNKRETDDYLEYKPVSKKIKIEEPINENTRTIKIYTNNNLNTNQSSKKNFNVDYMFID